MIKAYELSSVIRAHSAGAAHAMEVPPGARLLFLNGQVGARLDGTVPDAPADQLEIIFQRIETILTAAGMTFTDLVKLTVYVTDPDILDSYFTVRARVMKQHNPPATLLIVDSFPRSGVKVEIEAIAARAPEPGFEE